MRPKDWNEQTWNYSLVISHCQFKLEVGNWYFLSSLQLPTLAQRKVLDKKSGWRSVLLPETSNRCYFATHPNWSGFPSQGLHTGIYLVSEKWPQTSFAASSPTWFWFPRGQRGTQSSLVGDKYFIVWKGSWFWLFTHFGAIKIPRLLSYKVPFIQLCSVVWFIYPFYTYIVFLSKYCSGIYIFTGDASWLGSSLEPSIQFFLQNFTHYY